MSTVKINTELVDRLPTANSLLEEKYGEYGTQAREEFSVKARAWYLGEILKEKRKEKKSLKMNLRNGSERNESILHCWKKVKPICSYPLF